MCIVCFVLYKSDFPIWFIEENVYFFKNLENKHDHLEKK